MVKPEDLIQWRFEKLIFDNDLSKKEKNGSMFENYFSNSSMSQSFNNMSSISH
jgi:hypothetical protein